MADSLCLLDTNILLRWIKPDDRDYQVWNTCTRPLDRNGYGLTPKEADQRARFFEDRLRLLPDSLAVHSEWRQMLVAHSISGVQVHDARLVAAMRVHRVKRILSFNNTDFSRYRDIEAVNPHSLSTKHP